MENLENDILGFNPQELSVYTQNDESQHSSGNSLIYKTRPTESVSKDGVYRSIIKIVYNPFNLKQSILEQQSYSMQDANGWFSAVSSLTVNDKSCPIFKAWKQCRYAEKDSTLWKQSEVKRLFDKRFARYVTVQILEDKNQPDLEGKFMFWKLPSSIYDIINAKMNPSEESKKAPIPVMDFLFGRAIDLEVNPGPDDPNAPERKTREVSYLCELSEDTVSCINPDGSPLLTSDEQAVLDNYTDAMLKVWKSKDPEQREKLLAEINADPNTLELRKLYAKVLDQIKQWCPNLIEELGYKEWNDNLKQRVDNWIKVVLSGNDPKTYDPSLPGVVDAPSETPAASPSPAPAPASSMATTTTTDDSDDDLPF